MKKRGVSFLMRTKTWKEVRTALPVSSKDTVVEKIKNYEGVSIALYNTAVTADTLFQKPSEIKPVSNYPKYNCKAICDTIRKFIVFTNLKLFSVTDNRTFSIIQSKYQEGLSSALSSSGILRMGTCDKKDLELVVDIIKTLFEVISENLDNFFNCMGMESLTDFQAPIKRQAMMYVYRGIYTPGVDDDINNCIVESFSTGDGLCLFKDAVTKKFRSFRVDKKLYKDFNQDLIDAIIYAVERITV